MRTLLRKVLYWLAPSIELGDRAFVETAALRADVASLSLRLRVAEHSLAQRNADVNSIELRFARLHGHLMTLAHDSSKSAAERVEWAMEQVGKTNVRVALLELYMARPVYDGPVSDGRLDMALEKALESMAEVES
jgi:hypothetical protein